MGEPKTYASLSSGLLARKGGAKPAMRPQAVTSFTGNIEDLGWNDMGHQVEPFDHVPSSIAALTPAPNGRSPVEAVHIAPDDVAPVAGAPEIEAPEPVVVAQQRALEEHFPASESEEAQAPQTFAPQTFAPQTFAPQTVAPQTVAPEPVVPEPVVEARPAPAAEIHRLPNRNPVVVGGKGKAKAAFTLRLDPDRHLRLRLACAVTGRSAQQLVTSALDDFLTALPEVEELAARLPAGQIGR